MNVQGRPTFLQVLGSLIALPAALPLARKPSHWDGYDFAARETSDAGADHMWHAYPDECYAYTAFADSLVALAWGQGWYVQPPMVGIRNAIAVDFASRNGRLALWVCLFSGG